MNKIPVILLITVLLLACGSPSNSQPTVDAESVQETAIAVAWTEFSATQTAGAPTVTPTIPPPTNTPIPTMTSTPPPQPIVLTGSGDAVVDVSKWSGVALFRATYNSGSNFIVENFNINGEQIDLLVNTIGAYSGTQIIDVFDNEDTTRLSIKAAGPWEIQILPFSSVRNENVPGVIQGVGDDVILFAGNSPDLFKADASQARSNFIVFALSKTSYDLIFNEIAPYSGTVIAPKNTLLIEVKAKGAWSIEVTD